LNGFDLGVIGFTFLLFLDRLERLDLDFQGDRPLLSGLAQDSL